MTKGAESSRSGAGLSPATAPHPSGKSLSERYWVLFVLTLVYAINIADRFVLSALIEPIKAEFHLSDSGVAFLTGVALAIFYVSAGLPLGVLADRVNRRRLVIVSLVVWSGFTALCGLSRSFWQLLVSRIGVGIGEAGATPASHSLLADYFTPSERPAAMSVFALGSAIGSALGAIGGGLLADRYGWRFGLLAFSAASLPALLLLLTFREPRRGACDRGVDPHANGASLGETLSFIRKQRALLHVLAGGTVATFSGAGLVWWTPAFLSRSHGLSVGAAGLETGVMAGVGGAAAMVATMALMVRSTRWPQSWQCYFLAAVTALISIPALLAHLVEGRGLAILLLWLFVPFVNVYIGPCLALIQNLVRHDMRGLTVAILLFTANLANLAFAPQLIGLMSDFLAGHLQHPQRSLSYAIAIASLSGLWAAWHFWAATKFLPDHPRADGGAD